MEPVQHGPSFLPQAWQVDVEVPMVPLQASS
jgi:hypothetical protein